MSFRRGGVRKSTHIGGYTSPPRRGPVLTSVRLAGVNAVLCHWEVAQQMNVENVGRVTALKGLTKATDCSFHCFKVRASLFVQISGNHV